MPLFSKKVNAGTDFIKAADNLINNTVTNQQERGILKNDFTELFTSLEQFTQQQVTERLKSDNQGSLLTKNIRPLVLLILVLGFIFSDFLGISESKAKVMAEWGSLAIMFYYGARTVEKAIPMITEFIKSLRRKG